jgi:hypothetical protein
MGASSHAQVRSVGWLSLIFLVLFVPSLFLMVTAPPLWRDMDAWAQVTSPPNVSTLVRFGPAYCFGARVPMWIGTLVGAAQGNNDWPKPDFFSKPAATDAGIASLVLTQHLLLAGALTLLVYSASNHNGIRLGLCALCVIQAPLYIYAHCVGTETLTLILIIAMIALLGWLGHAGLRPGLVAVYSILLLVAILTRHANAVLAAMLPGVILLGAIIVGVRTRSRGGIRKSFKLLVFAIGISLLTIGASHILSWSIAVAGNQIYRSNAGYTLQWKLGYMNAMTREVRREYWQRVLGSPDDRSPVSDLIRAINIDRLDENGLWQTKTLFTQVLDKIKSLDPELSHSDAVAHAEMALNSLINAFLLRGGKPYWNSVGEDFSEGLAWGPGAISDQLVKTTTKFYDDPRLIEQPRNQALYELVTFKGRDANRVREVFLANPLFSFVPRLLPAHGVYLLIGLLFSLGLIAFGGPAQWRAAAVVLSVLATAVVMWFLTKLFTQDLPRFAAPLYASAFAALAFAVGQSGNAILGQFRIRKP